MDLSELRRHVNSIVRLSFNDGELVEARLLAVDQVEHHDLTYEVRRIVQPSRTGALGSRPGATVVAPLRELVSWAPVPAAESSSRPSA